jgi:CheY-like chemotaxis protein
MSNRILIVDDSRDFRNLMADLLGAVGYQVATAANGSAAIPQAVSFHPGLILMDVQMPELDGCEACKRIKHHPELSEIPVMLMSGDSGAASKAVAAGADAFMPKPFGLDRLVSRIRALIGRGSPPVCLQEAG